jgi:drug/metabolite transporter (DMT)-like permease
MFNAITLVILAALWGASFLFMRVATPEFGAIPLIAVRVTIAALFLFPFLMTDMGRRRTNAGTRPPTAISYFILGVLNSALPFSLFAYATLSLTAGFTAILNATAPFYGAIVARVWLKDRLTSSRIAGLLIGFSGVIVLSWGKASFKPGGTGWALLAGLVAACSYGIGASYTKRRFSGIAPLRLTALSQIAAAISLIPLALWLRPERLPSMKAWAMVAALGVFSTAVAYILYFRLIATLGPARAISVTFLIPVFGVLWGRLFLREPVTLRMLIGTGIILTGTALLSGVISLAQRTQIPSGEVLTEPAT